MISTQNAFEGISIFKRTFGSEILSNLPICSCCLREKSSHSLITCIKVLMDHGHLFLCIRVIFNFKSVFGVQHLLGCGVPTYAFRLLRSNHNIQVVEFQNLLRYMWLILNTNIKEGRPISPSIFQSKQSTKAG